MIKYKRMQNLLEYLYERNVKSSDPNSKILCKGEPLRVYALKSEELDFYNTMLIRNMFAYSAANMELRLSIKHLLSIYRLHKFEKTIERAGILHLFKEWLANDMMPISVQANKVPSTCPYVYLDYKQEEKIQQKQEIEQPDLKRSSSKSKPKQKQKGKKKGQQESPLRKQQSSKVIAMINILELTGELENLIMIRELGLQDVDFKNQQTRLDLIEQFQQNKIEEYINERFNTDTLMTFNFIRKYPYMDQKQLLNKTMLSAIQLRKCIANLIAQGLLNFYPENSRTMLYKAIPSNRLKQLYINHLSQTILNLLIYLDGKDGRDQEKTNIVLKTISDIDDILIVFMA